MTSITVSDLLTIIFVLIDDWYQTYGVQYLKGKPGAKPEFSDSEVITLLLAMDFIPFPSETQFLGFMRANYLTLFPRLVDQSQFNRRSRALRLLVEELRRSWLIELGVFSHTNFLLDTKPVPVVGVKRSNRHSDFAGSASYGYCPSRNMKYFGYKLVAVTTLDGIPVIYELVPAHTDERKAAEAVLGYLQRLPVDRRQRFHRHFLAGRDLWLDPESDLDTQTQQPVSAKSTRIGSMVEQCSGTDRRRLPRIDQYWS